MPLRLGTDELVALLSGVHFHARSLSRDIDQPQEQLQQSCCTHEGALYLDNTFVTAESRFEQDCLALSEDGGDLNW